MIQLYVRAGCPYCKKVETAAAEMGLVEGSDFELVDAAPNTPGREVVLKTGGKGMVPFLIDGEISMYESADIIDYLKAKK
ncbi:glutathione S-transferase N-terminal domain-containing protein [Desulforhopalus sp. IMCC35007]|uniref:glutathione S-transferase N-terminal domain-containing protein n=1 Tax=Desulforhopalus sp. IMCC35007 TaxID=2569543 RepID=UPI0010AE49A5|nr:glutathione S-transferase N-terminal domain-containing protein [Desulforhopalus sp. IMCC35007]TKB08330.1 glutaredoxin [Desulforhopalus sp. IMCC35007]